MTPHSDRDHAAIQRAAWDALWRLLLTPRPEDDEGRRNGSAAVDETAAAGGEVRDDVPVTRSPG